MLMDFIEFIIVVYIASCAGVGIFAMVKKFRFSDWMLISLFITPILGFFGVLFSKYLRDPK